MYRNENSISCFLEFLVSLNKNQKLYYLTHYGGRGVHPDLFVKLDFEIAVDQQTEARDQTFEGVPDSRVQVPAGQPRPCLSFT